jgi:xanthine/uracil permease
MLIGTMALCSLTSIGLSFLPTRQLKKIFPPVVTGTVICLIGISLIGSSGVLNWGGGASVVSQHVEFLPATNCTCHFFQKALTAEEDQPASLLYVRTSRRQSPSHSDRRR